MNDIKLPFTKTALAFSVINIISLPFSDTLLLTSSKNQGLLKSSTRGKKKTLLMIRWLNAVLHGYIWAYPSSY